MVGSAQKTAGAEKGATSVTHHHHQQQHRQIGAACGWEFRDMEPVNSCALNRTETVDYAGKQRSSSHGKENDDMRVSGSWLTPRRRRSQSEHDAFLERLNAFVLIKSSHSHRSRRLGLWGGGVQALEEGRKLKTKVWRKPTGTLRKGYKKLQQMWRMMMMDLLIENVARCR